MTRRNTGDCTDSPLAAMSRPHYAVITPVRNEAHFISKTIASMVAQSHRPLRWVIVDDGSADLTANIVEAASLGHDWITLVRRPDRGFRKSGGGVVEAFYGGYLFLEGCNWDFLVKLDGDLSFPSDYFDRCLARFQVDPQLGIAGGTVYISEGGRLRVDSPGDPPFHVRGATKIYRRACWDQISPLVIGAGWDTIDEVKANMLGWRTRSFQDISLEHHRKTGSADGAWRNWFKNGVGCYLTGYHPAFMLAKCLRRMCGQPPFIPGIALWAGYCSGYIARRPRATDDESVRYLRGQQLRRLMLQPSIYGDRK
jgi:biofilm PGA synthesis N-glycosyltransferase PgaC